MCEPTLSFNNLKSAAIGLNLVWCFTSGMARFIMTCRKGSFLGQIALKASISTPRNPGFKVLADLFTYSQHLQPWNKGDSQNIWSLQKSQCIVSNSSHARISLSLARMISNNGCSLQHPSKIHCVWSSSWLYSMFDGTSHRVHCVDWKWWYYVDQSLGLG